MQTIDNCSFSCYNNDDVYAQTWVSGNNSEKTFTVSCSEEENIGGSECMSTVVMGAKEKKIFCLSDSFSTDEKGILLAPDWTKIAHLPDRNMVISVAGDNVVKGQNIIDLVISMNDNALSAPGISNEMFLKRVTYYLFNEKEDGNTINFFAGYYVSDSLNNLTPIIKTYDINPLTVKEGIFGNNQTVYAGADSFLDFIRNGISHGPTFTETVEAHTDIIRKFIDLNKLSKYPRVGGAIQKILIDQHGKI